MIDQERRAQALAVQGRIFQDLLRRSPIEAQVRLGGIQEGIEKLPEIPVSRSLFVEGLFFDSFTEDQVFKGSHPDGAEYKAAKIAVDGQTKLLVLDITHEDERARVKVGTDFAIAVGRMRDFRRDAHDADNDEIGLRDDFDRLYWRLE